MWQRTYTIKLASISVVILLLISQALSMVYPLLFRAMIDALEEDGPESVYALIVAYAGLKLLSDSVNQLR
jgi:hypothetical protein